MKILNYRHWNFFKTIPISITSKARHRNCFEFDLTACTCCAAFSKLRFRSKMHPGENAHFLAPNSTHFYVNMQIYCYLHIWNRRICAICQRPGVAIPAHRPFFHSLLSRTVAFQASSQFALLNGGRLLNSGRVLRIAIFSIWNEIL